MEIKYHFQQNKNSNILKRAYENNDIIEKLYLRYCKYVLSVNKSTTSSMVYGELGRYLLNIEYTSRCILGTYYFRPSFKTVSKNV